MTTFEDVENIASMMAKVFVKKLRGTIEYAEFYQEASFVLIKEIIPRSDQFANEKILENYAKTCIERRFWELIDFHRYQVSIPQKKRRAVRDKKVQSYAEEQAAMAMQSTTPIGEVCQPLSSDSFSLVNYEWEKEHIYQQLSQLKKEEQFFLIHFYGLFGENKKSDKEIANMLGWSKKTCWWRRQEATQKLRNLYENEKAAG